MAATELTLPRITAPLPALALDAMHRLELALAETTVANFDNHGSLWGFDTADKAESDIARDHAEGAAIDEWETVDPAGQPLRVVRVTHPEHGIDICVFSTWALTSKQAV